MTDHRPMTRTTSDYRRSWRRYGSNERKRLILDLMNAIERREQAVRDGRPWVPGKLKTLRDMGEELDRLLPRVDGK